MTTATMTTNPDIQFSFPVLEAATEIVSAFCKTNPMAAKDVPDLITSVGERLQLLVDPASAEPEKPVPAVSVKKSLQPDHIVSLIDGKPYKMLKRHLSLHGYTPETYRAAFGLPDDYPMVCANYSAKRKELALKIGLGKDRKAKA